MPKVLTRFAMLEMNSQSDIYQNLVAIEYGLQQAVSQTHQRAKFFIVPENAFSFGNHKVASQHFEALKTWCGQLAREHNVYFLAGTLPCPFRPDGTPVPDNKYRQASLLFDPAGDCVARYDKIHLFKATVSEAGGKITQYDEGKTFEAGNTPVVAKTAIGNIGLMVCFDLRFPEMAKYLRQHGADILTAPSAFTFDTGKLHWQTLLQARALDAQCFLLGMGQTGTHFLSDGKLPNGKTRKTWGHSQFINAHGQIMPTQSLEVNPFLINQTFDENTTPLAKQALSWLNANNGDDKNIAHFPQNNTLYLTEFDPAEQAVFRNNIDLAKSERFGVTVPNE